MGQEIESCQVLIIDDFPASAELVKIILTRSRSDEIRVALSAYEGLAAAEQAPPDLIIIRIMMANLDGYEIYQRLQEMPGLRKVPVLLQAAIPPHLVYPKAQSLGVTGYLYQPFHPQDLIAARDAALRGEMYYPPLPERH